MMLLSVEALADIVNVLTFVVVGFAALYMFIIFLLAVITVCKKVNFGRSKKMVRKINSFDYSSSAPELRALGAVICSVLEADNEIDEKEYGVVRDFAFKMYDDTDAGNLLQVIFACKGVNIRKTCSQINSYFLEYIDRYAICELLFSIASVDNNISGSEWAVLMKILPNLKMSDSDIAYFRTRYAHLVNGGGNYKQYRGTRNASAVAAKVDKTQFYSVLGLTENATEEEVHRAYRALAKKYHPDTVQNPVLKNVLSDRFKEINDAYCQLRTMA